jgi:hypothetical protein
MHNGSYSNDAFSAPVHPPPLAVIDAPALEIEEIIKTWLT